MRPRLTRLAKPRADAGAAKPLQVRVEEVVWDMLAMSKLWPRLIYSGIISLDAYVADQAGKFDWNVPDTEVHTAINDLAQSVGTFLLGRRMDEVLVAWERMDVADQPTVINNFAQIWRAADNVVYSGVRTASSARTRIERTFRADEVMRMEGTAERNISVGGPNLAAHAIEGRPGRRVPPVRQTRARRRRRFVLSR